MHMMQAIHNFHGSIGERIIHKQPVCVNCSKKLGKVVRMYVKENGVIIPYGYNSAQVGDLLVCPVCHFEIVQGFSEILDHTFSNQVLESEYAILKRVKDAEL